MTSTPTIRQLEASGFTSSTSSSGTLTDQPNPLAGNLLVAFVLTNANLEADVTEAATWTPELVVHSVGAGQPILWVMSKVSDGDADIDLDFVVVNSGTQRYHVYEIGGQDGIDTDRGSNFAGSGASTSASCGTIAAPTALPGLSLAGVALSPSIAAGVSWSNGFTAALGASGQSLFTATKAYAGSGSITTTASWTGGSTPRTGLINVKPIVTVDGTLGWVLGAAVV